MLEDLLRALAELPPVLTYAILGLGAALENIVPPVPADTFVLFGAFLAAFGRADIGTVFLVTWLSNIVSALIVYGLARRYGARFFRSRVGQWLLHPRQLAQIGRFYARWGTAVIFGSRFLPGFRAVVPVFAGVSGVGFIRAALPIATASALWYGGLIYLGAVIGRNWTVLMDAFGRISDVLLWIAVPLIVIVIWWWRRTREGHED